MSELVGRGLTFTYKLYDGEMLRLAFFCYKYHLIGAQWMLGYIVARLNLIIS